MLNQPPQVDAFRSKHDGYQQNNETAAAMAAVSGGAGGPRVTSVVIPEDI